MDKAAAQAGRFQSTALIVGVVGIALAIGGFFIAGADIFYRSYLLGFVFWLQFGLASLALLMLHHIVGGKWSFTIRRFCETGALTLIPMALLAIPVILGMSELYIWTDPDEVAKSHLLQHKEPWLNSGFFIGRAVFYFAVWGVLALLLSRWSAQQDETGDPALAERMKKLSAFGLIVFMITATAFAFDWMMSLEPKWFSSIYGVIYISGGAMVTVSLLIILTRYFRNEGRLANWMSIDIMNDLSNFLLAFVAFWAYVSFSQFLIIWSANIPEEVTWYVRRSNDGWGYLAMFSIFFLFAIPFLTLLSRSNKRNPTLMVSLAFYVIIVRFIELFWFLIPAFGKVEAEINGVATMTGPSLLESLHWLYIVTPIGIGGLWLAAFFWLLQRNESLVPLQDPRFQEVPAHE